MTDEHNLSPAELEKRVKERKWEQVQIKGLTAWLNSYLNKAELPPVTTLPGDLTDGVKLLQTLELIAKGKQEKGESPRDPFPKYIEAPKSRIQKMENASKALKYITESLHIKLVGIGAEDIVDGNLRLVLGLLWSSFRALSLGSLSSRMGKGERDSKPEDDLLKWIASMTEGYGVEVTSFKTSFNDGRVWAALIDRFDPDYIDFPALNKTDKEGTLNLVFEIAEKKLGIPRLFEPSDLIDGNPDERSVILYSSLFYHAWTSNEERIRLANESRGLGSKMSEYKSKLEAEEEERQRLQRERDALKEEADSRGKALNSEEERIRQLEAAIKELLAIKEDIQSRLAKELEHRKTKFAKDVEKMGGETEKLKKELKEERKKAEEAAKVNAALMAENNALAEKVKSMNQLVGGLAGGDDFGNLAGLLREHVAALHLEMKRLEDTEKEDKEKAAINADHVSATELVQESLKSLQGQSEEKAKEKLGELLQGTSNTLIRIFKVADAQNELHEVVDKKGPLLAQVEGKRWKKRWFVLRGFFLFYYNKKEDQDDIAGAEGQVSLENSTVSVLNQDTKPNWAIKITISNLDERSSREELLIGTKTKEERDDWLFLLRGKILYLQYLALMESSHSRPDLRVVNLFSLRNVGTLHLEGVKITVPVLKILCGVLEDHEETERISLVGADLDDDGIALLSKVLEKMRGLLSLNFSRNRLTSHGVKTLVKSLSQHALLQEIDLAHNEIDDEGVGLLSELLEKNPDVDTVDLSHNKISGEDEKVFSALAKVFSSLKLLTALKFRHNHLGDAPMAALAKVVASHPGIVEILLGKNDIGDAGAKALFESLHDNQCVQKIDLSHNRIGTKGVEALKNLLAANKNIHSVDLSNNNNVIGGPTLSGFSDLKDVDLSDFVVHSV